MQPSTISKSFFLADGREITIETGNLARQADGAVVVKMGKTMILATVVAQKEAREDVDFLPLSVDYQEKFASAGKIPGGFLRREGKLSDYEVLICRLIDRAMRPIFPEDYHAETQINVWLISADGQLPPDCLAALAASAAVAVSDIPFLTPISEVRVIRVDGNFIINPTLDLINKSDLDLIVAGSFDNILMVEGEMKEVSEEVMAAAILFAHEAIKPQCQIQNELAAAAGKLEKRVYNHEKNDDGLKQRMYDQLFDKVYALCADGGANKQDRKNGYKKTLEDFILSEQEFLSNQENPGLKIDNFLVNKYYHLIQYDASRLLVLKERKRLDGRKLDEIRPIWGEVNYLPSAHGSAVFTRGETQSLTTVTLGTKLDEQLIDSALQSGTSKFILHYNFPSFSTGEIKPNRGPGRREIGHGNLAFRAIKPMLPPLDKNPYTIRIVSDILESNGSSSMATVCAGILALMDAGIQIKAPVAGIAMGLITNEETGEYAVLSDILGDEDHLGDMDFKVAGTKEGITACQMDIKTSGLSHEILTKALEQAKAGRLHILSKMEEIIPKTNEDLKPHAPRAVTIRIEREMIGAVIGPGGKVVQDIQKESGATVVIEEKDNAGYVNIFATNQESMDKAVGRVNGIVAVPVAGEVYEGIVKSIQPYGAFVEFLPGKEGLLHISEVKWERLESLEGILEVGEEIMVKLLDVDKKTGKYKLSRKVLIPKP